MAKTRNVDRSKRKHLSGQEKEILDKLAFALKNKPTEDIDPRERGAWQDAIRLIDDWFRVFFQSYTVRQRAHPIKFPSRPVVPKRYRHGLTTADFRTMTKMLCILRLVPSSKRDADSRERAISIAGLLHSKTERIIKEVSRATVVRLCATTAGKPAKSPQVKPNPPNGPGGFAQRVQQRRRELGLSEESLVLQLNRHQPPEALLTLMRGDQVPSTEDAHLFAGGLLCEVDWLLGKSNDTPDQWMADQYRRGRRWLLSPRSKDTDPPRGALPYWPGPKNVLHPNWFSWARDVFMGLSNDDLRHVCRYAAELAGVELPGSAAKGGKVTCLAEYRC